MNSTLEATKQQWAMPLAGWVLFIWFMSSALFFSVGWGLGFVPNDLGKTLLVLISLLSGVAIVILSIRNPTSNKKIRALKSFKKLLWIIFSPVLYGAMGAGNVYIAIFAIHSAMAEKGSTVLTVIYKGTDLDVPGRCQQYVRFKATFPFIRHSCVSVNELERIKIGSPITFNALKSPLGFQIEKSSRATQAD